MNNKLLFTLLLVLGWGQIRAQVTTDENFNPLDPLKLVFFGSSVPFGQGATNKRGYTSLYARLLSERATAGRGPAWQTANISIPGNNTVAVLDRWDRDLLPQHAKYVLYALALGNEGIHPKGQPMYDQFRANMQVLIERARTNGMVPIITNSYTRNDYNATDYAFIKQMNLLIQSWNVPSANLLGAVDDGAGHWAPGYWDDGLHPNDAGHAELMHALVPSLPDALRQGKPLPRRQPTAGVTLSRSKRQPAALIRFEPEDVVHPFTVSISFRTAGTSQLMALADSTSAGALRIEKDGRLSYQSARGGHLTSANRANDNRWHHLTLTHYRARGETILYLDSTRVGSLRERLLVHRFDLGGRAAPAPVHYRNWLFYRSGMHEGEAQALAADSVLKSSLELYAPLDGRRAHPDSLANLAQSTNVLARLQDKAVGRGMPTRAPANRLDTLSVGTAPHNAHARLRHPVLQNVPLGVVDHYQLLPHEVRNGMSVMQRRLHRRRRDWAA
jgi:lysophospholipase L1-like esterase